MIDSNERIIEGLKNGDKAVFEAIYREYFTPLCYYCLRYVDSYEDSEEIVQDIFIKLWNKHEEIEINISLHSYLYKAVQNYALNYLSKKKTHEKYLTIKERQISSPFDSGQDKMEEDELNLILKHAILKLPDKRRKIFELSRFDDFKYIKIAQKMSISVKTVEAQMTKTLKYLRVVLKDYVPILVVIILNNNII
jgi:RNA polymerase sigma-70 factor (ECF subfamily)